MASIPDLSGYVRDALSVELPEFTPRPSAIAGNPTESAQILYQDEHLEVGIWECTPGKVKIDYTEWEFCHFIEGEAVLTNESGQSWRLRKGDGFIIPPGFKGTWETVKPVRKHYVILTPKG